MPETVLTVDAPVAPGGIPILGHLPKLAVRRLEFLQSLRGGGDIVRIQLGSRPMYVLNAPEAIHEVLVTKSRLFGKGLLFDRVRPFMGNGIVTSDGEFHRRQRRALQPAFHRERITEYTGALMDAARPQVEAWPAGQVMAMEKEMRRLAVAMLLAALFPPGSDAATNQMVEDMGERICDHLGVMIRGVLRYTLLPSVLAAVPTPSRRRFLAAAVGLRQLADAAIRQARHEPAHQPGMLTLMLSGTPGMSDEEARDELLTIFLAGVETTGTSLAWALYALGTYPEIAERVSREARAAAPAAADAEALPYTARFVKEVLRLHQPNWIMMRRATAPVRIGSIDLPVGAEVIYSAATLHRDAAYFPDPLRFDPDRWLTRPEKDLPRCTYLPFATGNRKCIADSFAWAEMLVALTTITSRWRLSLLPGCRVRVVADAQIHPDSLPMSVTPRDS